MIDELFEMDYALWPDVLKFVHQRAMDENGWDKHTAYVQMRLGLVWLPIIELEMGEKNDAVERLPLKVRYVSACNLA